MTKLVLIAEDNAMIALSMMMELEDAGFEPLGPAGRVEQALKLAEARRPDLALVDVDLQGGDSGLDLARELHRTGVPVLYVTGQANLVTEAEGNRHAVGLLKKPFPTGGLAVAVTAALSGERAEGDLPAQLVWF